MQNFLLEYRQTRACGGCRPGGSPGVRVGPPGAPPGTHSSSNQWLSSEPSLI